VVFPLLSLRPLLPPLKELNYYFKLKMPTKRFKMVPLRNILVLVIVSQELPRKKVSVLSGEVI